MEGEETERLAGFTARAASAPDGLQSGRETAGSCSVYMPSSRPLPRGSERVYDYAGGREERKRNVVDVPKYAPFRLFPFLRLLLLLVRLATFCFYRVIFRTVSLPSKQQEKDATKSLAIVRLEILVRAFVRIKRGKTLVAIDVARKIISERRHGCWVKVVYASRAIRPGMCRRRKEKKGLPAARETTGKDACNNARRVPLAEKQA